MDFLTLKPETFGLDISDLSLKIVKLKKDGNYFGLASFGEAEIKPGVIESGEIKNEELLAGIIKESLNQVKGEKLKTKHIVASLPEEKAFLQVIPMPFMEEKELKKAAFFEAENYVPVPLAELYLDSLVIPPLYDHLDHYDVLIAAAPKKIIDPYLSCFKKAGLQPAALEIESMAIARALIKNGVSASPLLLIDLGETRTSFIIFSGYSLKFTTSIPVSSHGLTEAIAKNLNLPFPRAEALKIKYGLAEKSEIKVKNGPEKEIAGSQIFDALVPLLTVLVEEIRKHIGYYQTHTSHEHLPSDRTKISKILLCGGGANLKGLINFLTVELKLPVELGNPWVNILPESLKQVPELSYEKSLGYTTALGLALKGARKK